ncbi:MAG: peptidylprolyl isomerase [Candidatus Eisenbacteria bacterium]|nr:peptidylprolyl isomerase [Candidatus Eisenbacteria bacterium]
MKFLRWAFPALLAATLVAPGLAQRPKATASNPPPAPVRSAPATPAGAAQRLDGIAAVVNDDVVLQSDVEEQLYLFLMNNQMRPDSAGVDTLRRQILDQLINEKLIVAEAKRQGVTAPETEVNREVEKAMADARKRLGEDGFREQLQRENLSEEKLRARYREAAQREITSSRLLQKQFPRKSVPAAEAEAFFKENPDKFPKAPAQVKLSVIQIPATPDSAADAAAKAKLLAVRKRILAGEKFAKLAAEVSEDPGTAKSGGDLGFFARGSYEPAIEDAAFALKVGELSQPVRTPYGWHLLEPLERDTLKTAAGRDSLDAAGTPVLEAHARHILVRVQLTEADADRAKALAEKVREQAVKGVDFATLVHRYSRYEGPAAEDGDIGFVSMATLQPQIRAGLDTLEVGQASEVLANQIGYNIFKVTDRKPARPYTLEEIRDELPEAVSQIKARERLDEWVKTLRARAHIEIRSS